MMEEEIRQIVNEVRNLLDAKEVNFICYIWDKENKYGVGFISKGADLGNGLVVIQEIIKQFNIRPDILRRTLEEVKLEMEKN